MRQFCSSAPVSNSIIVTGSRLLGQLTYVRPAFFVRFYPTLKIILICRQAGTEAGTEASVSPPAPTVQVGRAVVVVVLGSCSYQHRLSSNTKCCSETKVKAGRRTVINTKSSDVRSSLSG